MIQLAPSVKNKNVFFICQRVWKTVKCQGEIREKSENFEVDDKWQTCIVAFVDKVKKFWYLIINNNTRRDK